MTRIQIHFIATLTLTIISVSCCLSQDFENAIELLEIELDYELQDSIKTISEFDEQLARRFEICSKYQTELSQLNLNDVLKSRSAFLKQPYHNGNYTYSSFFLIETKFKSSNFANQFKLTLDQLGHRTECISKGGIMWWVVEDRLYFILSRAYFMTYKYAELKSVIDKAIN